MTLDDILAQLEALPENEKQEYRDILDRQMAAQQADVAAAKAPGPFDEALARFREAKLAAAGNPPQADVSGSSYLFDGGEAEARSIFRRNDEIPDNGPEALPDAGVGKGDRLPVSAPELPQPPSAFDSRRYGVGTDRADSASGLPAARGDDSLKAFEIDTPLHFDGEDRVEELQGNNTERPLAIKQSLKSQINYAAQKNGVGVEVHSGGQVAKGEVGPRTKSSNTTRHDHGDAADVDLYVIEDGQRRYLDSENPQDRRIMQNFIRDVVAAGATGIGHGYMRVSTPNGSTTTRRIHVGGGKPTVSWSDQFTDQRHKPPFPWLEATFRQGVGARDKLLKSGAWPNPTAPLKFMPQVEVLDSPHAAGGEAGVISMMRDLIRHGILPGKTKK